MAYLKLMMDEKEIAHLSEDGQSLCANEGVPQYSLPLNLFIGDKREVPLVDVVVWAKKRIFPKNRMDCKASAIRQYLKYRLHYLKVAMG